MLRLLAAQELTVSELCAVLQLPQSTVSRHLKTLADGDWVLSRRHGTSRFYAMAADDLDEGARSLWTLVLDQVGGTRVAQQDDRRLAGVLARRSRKSREFFTTAAGQWDRLREELFGAQVHLRALPALLDDSLVAGDLGCGTGTLTAAIAPFVARVVGVDASAEMLDAARRRTAALENVDLRQGELESLPLDTSCLDAALMMLVLHYMPEPPRAIAEAGRVVRAGGRLLVVDMLPHDRDEYQATMGHVWLGFSETQVQRWFEAGGFERPRVHVLPADPAARGPSLFAAAARRAA
jgi:ArsR family transcriptional regulator